MPRRSRLRCPCGLLLVSHDEVFLGRLRTSGGNLPWMRRATAPLPVTDDLSLGGSTELQACETFTWIFHPGAVRSLNCPFIGFSAGDAFPSRSGTFPGFPSSGFQLVPAFQRQPEARHLVEQFAPQQPHSSSKRASPRRSSEIVSSSDAAEVSSVCRPKCFIL